MFVQRSPADTLPAGGSVRWWIPTETSGRPQRATACRPEATVDARFRRWLPPGEMSAAENSGRYLLIPRPAALSEDPSGSNRRSYWDAPHAYRLWALALSAQGPDGRPSSHDLQVKIGAPDLSRGRSDEDVVLWLQSGWWITLRHEFAAAPRTAAAIVTSAADELSIFTAKAADARGEAAAALQVEWEQQRFAAVGPAVWLGRD